MQLRTFIGRDLPETLAQVKRELGPEAVILSTQYRKVSGDGARGRRRREIEVTAAIDCATPAAASQRPAGELPGPAAPDPYEVLRTEIRDLRALLVQHLKGTGQPGPAMLLPHPELMAFHQELISLGLSRTVINHWLAQLGNLATKAMTEPRGRSVAVQALEQTFAVVDPWQAPVVGPRCWVFLGATGVGKTTTLAKLAVQAALGRRQAVGLISLDHQRLGALEQLAAFSRLADLPLLAAHNPGELAQAVSSLSHLDGIFIDTPGYNPYEPQLAGELRRLFGGFPHLACHLLISAGAAESHMAAAIQAFGALPLSSLILTKVDESRDLGAAFNQLCHSRVPLSYLTTGQRVPEDLEPASPSRLVALLLEARPWTPATPGTGEFASEVTGHAGM